MMHLVLSRLRKAEINNEKPNDVYVSLSIGKYSNLLEDSTDFRSQVESAISDFADGSDDYRTAKLNHLRTLGYEESSATFKVSFLGITEEDILDAFLGLSSISGTVSEATDDRFNLPLPIGNFPTGSTELNFSPFPAGTAQLSFRRDQTSRALRFSGSYYRAPVELQTEVKKVLVKLDLYQIVIRYSHRSEDVLSLHIDNDATSYRSKNLECGAWQDYFDLQNLFHEGSVLVDLSLGGNRLALSEPASVDRSSTDMHRVDNARAALTALRHLLSYLGLERDTFRIEAINPNFNELLFVAEILKDKDSAVLTFTTIDAPDENTFNGRIGVILTVSFKDLKIGVACTAEFSTHSVGTEYEWVGRNIRLGFAREVGPSQQDIEAFAIEAQAPLGTARSVLLQRTTGEETGDVTIFSP